MKKKYIATLKYTAAVIGCGRMGAEEWNYPKEIRPETHAACYRKHPKIDLIGFADTNFDKLKKAGKYFPGVRLFDSAEKMFKEIKPDIVSIATNSDSHYSLVKLAANYKTKSLPIMNKKLINNDRLKIVGYCNTLIYFSPPSSWAISRFTPDHSSYNLSTFTRNLLLLGFFSRARNISSWRSRKLCSRNFNCSSGLIGSWPSNFSVIVLFLIVVN